MSPKLCECGCGEPAPIARFTNKNEGLVKGQPLRFVHGHQGRRHPLFACCACQRCNCPCHKARQRSNRFDPRRHVRVGAAQTRPHRAIAQQALGKPLPLGVDVHHHSDTQLVICQDRGYHMLLEARTRVVRAGGDPDLEAICGHCHQVKPLIIFSRNRASRIGRQTICKPCRAIYERARVKRAACQ
jgi:hypothetical protein